MSRIGKLPVVIPAGVTVDYKDNIITVKGPKGELNQQINPAINLTMEDGHITFEENMDVMNDNPKQRHAYHGLYRALVHNMVVGVSAGYQKQLSIEGTGFKAVLQGKNLALSLGFASPKIYPIPEGLTVTVENDGLQVTVKGCSKELVGEAAFDELAKADEKVSG